MRSGKYRVVTGRVVTGLERFSNRLMRFALHTGIAPQAFALLETTGRRLGQPRHRRLINLGLTRTGDTWTLTPATP